MRLRSLAIVALPLAASCAQPAAAPAPPPPPLASGAHRPAGPEAPPDAFTGVVLDPRGAPIEGAVVGLIPHFEPDADEGAPPVILSRSERGGAFRFPRAPPARYGVTATFPGLTAAYGGLVTIAPGKPASPVALKLGHEGITLTGTVRDEAGGAAAGVMVDALPFVEAEGSVFVTITGADGRYSLTIPGGVPCLLIVDAPPRPRTYRRLDPVSQVADMTLEPAPSPRPSDEAIAAWLQKSAIRLATVDAGHGFQDMEPLRAVIGDARIVALGEATHNSSEFFRMKHRLLEFLVEQMGFTVFGIEAPFSEALKVNDYVLHGKGDPAAALAGVLAWIWNTEEVLAMIRWMRRYNEAPSHPKKIQFWGFDILTPAAFQAVLAYLKKVDPPAVKAREEALSPLRLLSAGETYPGTSSAVKAATQKGIADLKVRLDAQKKAYLKRSLEAEWELARQHAEVLRQAEVSYRDESLRDVEMARNVTWLLDHPARGGKIVLWAHNNHVSLSPVGLSDMGRHLRQRYGKDYFALGFSFRQGSFRALDATDPGKRWGPARVFSLGPAPEGSFEAALGLAKLPLFAVDLRAAEGEVKAWLGSRSAMRVIRGYFASEQRALERHSPGRSFDAMIFVDQVTAARPNPPLPKVGEGGAR